MAKSCPICALATPTAFIKCVLLSSLEAKTTSSKTGTISSGALIQGYKVHLTKNGHEVCGMPATKMHGCEEKHMLRGHEDNGRRRGIAGRGTVGTYHGMDPRSSSSLDSLRVLWHFSSRSTAWRFMFLVSHTRHGYLKTKRDKPANSLTQGAWTRYTIQALPRAEPKRSCSHESCQAWQKARRTVRQGQRGASQEVIAKRAGGQVVNSIHRP